MSETTETKTVTSTKAKGEIGPSMIGSEILVSALEREGVDTIFAYPGGASMEFHQSSGRVTAHPKGHKELGKGPQPRELGRRHRSGHR